MKRYMDFLAGVQMTIVAGVFLVFSLILMLTGETTMPDPAWVTIVICGLPLLYLALTRLIFDRWISSALLISMAMLASIGIGEIFAAGEVAFIMSIGALLEDFTVARAKKGIGQLASLAPVQGRVIKKESDHEIEEILPIEKIQKGDILRVLPGERIPVDGRIVSGNTSVDQSVMTGESLPVDKAKGEEVFCGTLNCYGSIDMEASHVEDSSLQKMIDLVKEAENKKAPMQRIADQWSVWLVPVALLIAIAAWLITGELVRGVTVLVVFCPCALALATPTTIVAAIGQATKHGVLIKSGEALEMMGKTDCIAFDKTGTLTYGNLEVSEIVPFSKGQQMEQDVIEELLKLTASAEKRSEHPLGKAIVRYAKNQGISLYESEDFQMIPGKGIQAVIEKKNILCGNKKYLLEQEVSFTPEMEEKTNIISRQGKAAIFTAVDGRCIGMIALADETRPQAAGIIEKLKSMGNKIILLTGDNELAAAHLAEKTGIDHIHANLLPADKVAAIEEMQNKGQMVCMIGDGVNDAPALKTAAVGVAMGSMGSDIAVEAADIALMSDNIENIAYLKRLSTSAVRTIKGNITVSMCINAVAVTLSVLGVLNPVTGALVHNAGSCLVVLNAALLYDRKFDV